MTKRYTRLSSPPTTADPYLTRVWRAITELQNDAEPLEASVTAVETGLAAAETDLAALNIEVDGLGAAAYGAWAVITASGDQSGIDEAATPDLVTAFDTVYDGSASHGVTVSGGVITLPANTSGYQWEVRAEVWVTHSAAGQAGFRFYEAPSGANTAIGLSGLQNSATYTGNGSQGGAGDALAWLSGGTTVGLRCTVATGATTMTVESEWSRIICREVKA